MIVQAGLFYVGRETRNFGLILINHSSGWKASETSLFVEIISIIYWAILDQRTYFGLGCWSRRPRFSCHQLSIPKRQFRKSRHYCLLSEHKERGKGNYQLFLVPPQTFKIVRANVNEVMDTPWFACFILELPLDRFWEKTRLFWSLLSC